MDGAQLQNLCASDLFCLHTDCGLEYASPLRKEKMVADILEWQRRLKNDPDLLLDREKHTTTAHTTSDGSVASSGPASESAPCTACGWKACGGICACSFISLDPMRPVTQVLALTTLAASPRSTKWSGRATAVVRLTCQSLAEGEGIELRMQRRQRPSQHEWPRSAVVLVDDVEVGRVDPPAREDVRRSDEPMDISQHVLAHRDFCLRLEADRAEQCASDFVFCVVRSAPRRTVSDMLGDCLRRPRALARDAAALWSTLRVGEAGIECTSTLLQPFICPLTRDRMRVPARGRGCRHLRCFELQAYLEISARTAFHRRWQCPVCDCRLPPLDIIVCGFTMHLLQDSGPSVDAADLESALCSVGDELRGSPASARGLESGSRFEFAGPHAAGAPQAAGNMELVLRSRGRRRWRRLTPLHPSTPCRTPPHCEGLARPRNGAHASGKPATWHCRLKATAQRVGAPIPMELD
mmetsp:Transcript_57833/g.161422  ORF Transcript_57833/g.161422 Transcript_57833/m.161422 type:complete len:467 (+) Transcript_57833:57-1457(+)